MTGDGASGGEPGQLPRGDRRSTDATAQEPDTTRMPRIPRVDDRNGPGSRVAAMRDRSSGRPVSDDDTQVVPRVQYSARATPAPSLGAPTLAGAEGDRDHTTAVRDRYGVSDQDVRQEARAMSPDVEGEPRTSGATKTRRAHLHLVHIDPWSVMKTVLVIALCLFLVALVATAVVWYVLDAAGVFSSVIRIADSFPSLDAASYVSFNRVMGTAAFLGALNVVLTTALATVMTMIYNLAAGLAGGVEVTLAERHH